MGTTPIATPRTEGRVFDTDWSVDNVAKLLRANAGRGVWRAGGGTGGSTASVNRYYLRTVSAQHLPTRASLIFARMEEHNCWYLSLCFAGGDGYLPWNPDTAELWLWALFGDSRPSVREVGGGDGNVRQFTLRMPE